MKTSIRLKSIGLIGLMMALLLGVVAWSFTRNDAAIDSVAALYRKRELTTGMAGLQASMLSYRRASRLAIEGIEDPNAPSMEDVHREVQAQLQDLRQKAASDPAVTAAIVGLIGRVDAVHALNVQGMKLGAGWRERVDRTARDELKGLVQALGQVVATDAVRTSAEAYPRWRAAREQAQLLLTAYLLGQKDENEEDRSFAQRTPQLLSADVTALKPPPELAQEVDARLRAAQRAIEETFRIRDEFHVVVDDRVEAAVRDLYVEEQKLRSALTADMSATNMALRGSLDSTKVAMTWVGVFSVLLGVVGLIVFVRTVLRPLDRSIEALEVLGEGDADLTKTLPEVGDKELVRLAKAFNRFAGSMAKEIRQIVALSQRLSGIVQRFNGLSQSLSETSEATRRRAEAASHQATDVDGSMQSISAAVEEMTASISEIASHSSNSQDLSHRVASMAAEANQQIKRLGASSSEIGEVVKVITSIAEQTNLLALNATIESARAGEAGRGFAVVANEVKELAKGTGEATGDISRKVEAIQSDTRAAIEVIERIAQMIDQVTEAATTIAAAVQEQSATSGEISQSVHRAAKGTNGILDDVRQVTEAADRAGQCRDDLLGAAREIASSSTELQGIVGRYRL